MPPGIRSEHETPDNYHFGGIGLCLQSCVPNRAFQSATPTARYVYPKNNYYVAGSAGLAFIEFLKDGSLADKSERDAAYQMIDQYNAAGSDKSPIVFVFVHGWKNNASEQSGNVWGFRRALDFFSSFTARPVLGIYIGWPGVGWPGQNTGFVENVSFSDRESVAYAVGGRPLRETLAGILHHAKGSQYSGSASVVLMGHSFGGVVLESAVTPLLKRSIDAVIAGRRAAPPADLIVLINEAGSAQLARPFLYYLKEKGVHYRSDNQQDSPLLLSITSTGDVVTKFAFPGGQWISPHRPKDLKKIEPPDTFGIDNDKTYYLLTTANTIALQNHAFQRRPNDAQGPPPDAYVSVTVGGKAIYDLVPMRDPNPKNTTPYWVAQLPQVFVPDHGEVFGYEFMNLVNQFLMRAQLNKVDVPHPVLTKTQ